MTDQSDLLSGETVEQSQVAQTVEQPEVTETNVTAEQVDPNSFFTEQLSSIVNEETGKPKYSSVQDALNSIPHAQNHVKTLEQDNAQLRSELEEMRTMFEETQSQIASTQEPEVTAQPTVSRDDVYSMFKEYEQKKTFESNRQAVVDTLVNHFNGDQVKATEYIDGKLKEVGMGREELQLLAQRSPQAVYRVMGIDTEKGTKGSSYTQSTINSDAIETHVKKELPKPKALPIGAGTEHLVNEWRTAQAEANEKLGIE